MRFIATVAAFFALCAPAQAGLGISWLHGDIYWAHPHHWYTNDGRHYNGGSVSFNSHESHHHEHHHKNNDSDPLTAAEHRELHTACNRMKALYMMRHGFRTPNSLRGEVGCEKWTEDAMYHDTHPSVSPFAIGREIL